MAEQRVTNQWQLEDTGESLDQWKLQDNEQRLPAHMQLHDEYDNPDMMDAAWQPIDYRAMQAAATGKSRRGGKALGALLVVALLGVGAYLAWFYMGQPTSFGELANGTTAPTEVARTDATVDPSVAPAVSLTDTTAMTDPTGETSALPADAAQTAPVTAPAVTEPVVLPEPTAVPVLPATAEVRQAVMNSEFGVNLRASATATAALLATLDDKTTHVVASGPVADAAGANWYELALADGTRGWVSGDFITVTLQTLPFAEAQTLLQAVGITLAAPESAPAADTASVTTTAPAEGVVLPVPTPSPGAATDATIRVTAVISAPAGLNLRSAAEAGENVLQQVADTTAVSVIGRSADGAWLQLELADGTRGWASSAFVSVTGDLNAIPAGTTLPLTAADAPAVAAAADGTAAAPTAAPSVAATAPVTAATVAPAVGATTAFTVTSVMGVNVRAQPSNDVPGIVQLSWNASGQATGRTADNNWVQVTIPSGQSGWVAASAVSLEGDIATLPAVQ